MSGALLLGQAVSGALWLRQALVVDFVLVGPLLAAVGTDFASASVSEVAGIILIHTVAALAVALNVALVVALVAALAVGVVVAAAAPPAAPPAAVAAAVAVAPFEAAGTIALFGARGA